VVGVFASTSLMDAVVSATTLVGIFDGGMGVSASSNRAEVGVEGGDFGVSFGIDIMGVDVGDDVIISPSISNSKVSVSSKSPPVVSIT
jgi:hypothetical protein